MFQVKKVTVDIQEHLDHQVNQGTEVCKGHLPPQGL